MFIGHYGPALAAKPIERRLPLWLLFLAVQWLDVVWSVLVLLDVERLRIVKGFTQGSPLDLYYMPYTHGLIGALALSAALGAIISLFYRERRTAVVLVVAGAVFSHWLLDLAVHVPDLPLWADSFKVGFGLWRNVWISFPLELATLFAGAWIYARAVPSASPRGNRNLWLLIAFMAALQIYGAFGPQSDSPAAQAQLALVAYLLLAVLAGLVDWTRGTMRASATDGEHVNELRLTR